MAINYGGCEFTEPILAACWSPPSKAGLYAVLVRDDIGTPRRFRAIYFGETENFAERGFLRSHHRYDSWIREAGGSDMSLYIALYPTPDLTKTVRLETEKSLIDLYAPVCNRPPAEALEIGARFGSKLAGIGMAQRTASLNPGLAGQGLKVRK